MLTITYGVIYMKKQVRSLMASVLALSVLIGMTGCGKSTVDTASQTEPAQSVTVTEKQKETAQTFNTDSYDVVVPTGTRVSSENPNVPENIVYWSPTRAPKDRYTIEEALEKYAFVVGHSTLIYTRCDELRLDHEFYCVDYGYELFWNENSAYFLGSDGKWLDSFVNSADLEESDCNSLSEFTEKLGWIYVGNMGHYSPEDPDAPKITVVEQTEDHVYATVKILPHDNEALYYAKLIGGKVFYTVFKVQSSDRELTDKEREGFVRYSKILFEHLSEDDHAEPYIYDKLVNTPILGGKRITGFNNIYGIHGKLIELRVKEKAPMYSIYISPDADDSYLAKKQGYTDWVDSDGVKMRENSRSGSKDFVFTIDGTRYFCSFQLENDKKVNADSLASLMKLIGDYSYVK